MNTAVENGNSEEILKILRLTDDYTNGTNNETELGISQPILVLFFKMAVKDCKTEWVERILSLIAKKAIHFDIGASVLKENFNDLWLDHSGFIEAMISKAVVENFNCKHSIFLSFFKQNFSQNLCSILCSMVVANSGQSQHSQRSRVK